MGDRFCIQYKNGLRWVAESERALVKPEAFVPCEDKAGPPVEPKDVYETKGAGKQLDLWDGQVSFGYASPAPGQYGGVYSGEFGCDLGVSLRRQVSPWQATLSWEPTKPIGDNTKPPKVLDKKVVGKK